MSTHNTPRTSATIFAVDGNGLTLANISRALSPADVGRLIIMTTGEARQQVRKITQVIGNNQITIDHPFNEAAFPWITEVNPVFNDHCAFSYRITDLDPSDGDITRSSNNLYTIDNLELDGGAYLHMEDVDLRFNSQTFEIRAGGGLILGWYSRVADEPARPIHTCSLRDNAPNTGGDSMRRTTAPASFGLYHQYGGGLYVPAECFWRLYQDTPDVDVRFIDVNIKGGFGARVDGNNSILIATVSNNTADVGTFNPRSAVAYSEVAAIDSLQIGYLWLREGADGKFRATDAVNLDRGFRIFTSGGGAGSVYRIEGKKAQFDNIGTVYWAQGGDAPDHRMRFVNDIKPSFVNQDTTAHLGTISTYLENANALEINRQTINDGQMEVVEGIHSEWITKNNGGGSQSRSFADNDTITTAPYTITACAWGKDTLEQTISLEDTFAPPLTLLNDVVLTETDYDTVNGYTVLETALKLYDRVKLWQATHPEQILPVQRFGTNIDFGSVAARIALDFDAATAYPINSMVYENGRFYRNTAAAVAAGAFNAADWVQLATPANQPLDVIDGIIHFYAGVGFTGSMESTATIEIVDEAVVNGTITDSVGIRLRLLIANNSVVKGSYQPPAPAAAVQIPFETLPDGVKIIRMPANSSITLFTKAPGFLEQLRTFNTGTAGITYRPPTVPMNGTVSDRPWLADVVMSDNGFGGFRIVFNSAERLSEHGANNQKGLTTDDITSWIDHLHRQEAYATECLTAGRTGILVVSATNEVESRKSLAIFSDTPVSDDIWIAATFRRLSGDIVIGGYANDNLQKARVNLGLDLVDQAIAYSARDVGREFSAIALPEFNDIEVMLTAITGSIAQVSMLAGDTDTRTTALASTISAQGDEINEIHYRVANTQIPIKVFKAMPPFTLNSQIAEKFEGGETDTGSNPHEVMPPGIIRIRRTAADPTQFVLLFHIFAAPVKLGGSAAGAADEFALLVRNPGARAETLEITASFHSNAATINETTVANITLSADSDYELVIFKLHQQNTEASIDEMRFKIVGLDDTVDLEQMAFYKVSIEDGTILEKLDAIEDDVSFIKKGRPWPL